MPRSLADRLGPRRATLYAGPRWKWRKRKERMDFWYPKMMGLATKSRQILQENHHFWVVIQQVALNEKQQLLRKYSCSLLGILDFAPLTLKSCFSSTHFLSIQNIHNSCTGFVMVYVMEFTPVELGGFSAP